VKVIFAIILHMIYFAKRFVVRLPLPIVIQISLRMVKIFETEKH